MGEDRPVDTRTQAEPEQCGEEAHTQYRGVTIAQLHHVLLKLLWTTDTQTPGDTHSSVCVTVGRADRMSSRGRVSLFDAAFLKRGVSERGDF